MSASVLLRRGLVFRLNRSFGGLRFDCRLPPSIDKDRVGKHLERVAHDRQAQRVTSIDPAPGRTPVSRRGVALIRGSIGGLARGVRGGRSPRQRDADRRGGQAGQVLTETLEPGRRREAGGVPRIHRRRGAGCQGRLGGLLRRINVPQLEMVQPRRGVVVPYVGHEGRPERRRVVQRHVGRMRDLLRSGFRRCGRRGWCSRNDTVASRTNGRFHGNAMGLSDYFFF